MGVGGPPVAPGDGACESMIGRLDDAKWQSANVIPYRSALRDSVWIRAVGGLGDVNFNLAVRGELVFCPRPRLLVVAPRRPGSNKFSPPALQRVALLVPQPTRRSIRRLAEFSPTAFSPCQDPRRPRRPPRRLRTGSRPSRRPRPHPAVVPRAPRRRPPRPPAKKPGSKPPPLLLLPPLQRPHRPRRLPISPPAHPHPSRKCHRRVRSPPARPGPVQRPRNPFRPRPRNVLPRHPGPKPRPPPRPTPPPSIHGPGPAAGLRTSGRQQPPGNPGRRFPRPRWWTWAGPRSRRARSAPLQPAARRQPPFGRAPALAAGLPAPPTAPGPAGPRPAAESQPWSRPQPRPRPRSGTRLRPVPGQGWSGSGPRPVPWTGSAPRPRPRSGSGPGSRSGSTAPRSRL